MKKSMVLLMLLSVLGFMMVGCSATTTTQPAEPAKETMYKDISVMDAKDFIANTPDLVIIDVSPAYADGHLPNAISYALGDGSLTAAIPTLDMNKTYLVYCHTDAASMEGAQMLVDAGFKMVYRMDGNYSGWVDAGYPVEK